MVQNVHVDQRRYAVGNVVGSETYRSLKAGYVYADMDNCWAASRMSNGYVVSELTTFPTA